MTKRATPEEESSAQDDELADEQADAKDGEPVDDEGDAEDAETGDEPDADATDEAPSSDEAPDVMPWGFLASRVTGLFLAAFVVAHFTVNFVFNDVGRTTAGLMTSRWMDNSPWRWFEWIVMVLAFVHAGLAIGARVAKSDLSSRARFVVDSVTIGGCGMFIVAVTVVALTYR